MIETGSHSNIEILTLGEVENLVESAESKVRKLLGREGGFRICTARAGTNSHWVVLGDSL